MSSSDNSMSLQSCREERNEEDGEKEVEQWGREEKQGQKETRGKKEDEELWEKKIEEGASDCIIHWWLSVIKQGS